MRAPDGSILAAMDRPVDEAPGSTRDTPNVDNDVDLYQLRARTIANLELLLEQAQAETELMRRSVSWRLTAPLRAAGRVARRLLGRGS